MSTPDLTGTEANPNPKLSAAEATLRHWASGASCHITPEAVDLVLAEYDRRGTAEQAGRDAVDAWRRSSGPANAQGLILSGLADALAGSSPGAPPAGCSCGDPTDLPGTHGDVVCKFPASPEAPTPTGPLVIVRVGPPDSGYFVGPFTPQQAVEWREENVTHPDQQWAIVPLLPDAAVPVTSEFGPAGGAS